MITDTNTALAKIETTLKYPVLMEHIGIGGFFIVLFEDEESGMVVRSTVENRPVGHYEPYWIPATERITWKKFRGSITLEQN
jgi:hypothetical protein